MNRTLAVSLIVSTSLLYLGCGTANNAPNPTTLPSNAPTNTSTNGTAQQPAKLTAEHIALTVLPGGRLGPDGKMHDTFTNPNFTLVQGTPVTITVYNYDNMKHSITTSALNLNLQAKPSKKTGVPGVTSETFTPTKAGQYTWRCIDPCDLNNGGWAMSHKGYMQGTIAVVPYSGKQYAYLTIKDGLKYAAADKKIHDSFSPADFKVQAGIPVQVHTENFDTGKHSFTSQDLNVNQVFKGANKKGVPSDTTFTFTPTKSGTYHWHCAIPCDDANNGWAMAHDGYMMGTVTAVS